MRPLRRLQPVLAALLAACVLLLGLASWSPDLHARLHAGTDCGPDHEHPAPDRATSSHGHYHGDSPATPASHADEYHGCAVNLFASGCDVAPTAVPLSPPLELSPARVAAFTEWMLARTLRGPERVCGPPALA